MLSEAVVGEFIDAVVIDPDKAEKLLAANPELTSSTWIHGESLVHFLTIEGYEDGVVWLLNHGFDVNTTDEFGDTPIVHAVMLGKLRLIKVLADSGADCSVVSPSLGTLWDVAEISQHSEVIQLVRELLLRKDKGPNGLL